MKGGDNKMKLYRYTGTLYCSIPEEALPKNVIFDSDYAYELNQILEKHGW